MEVGRDERDRQHVRRPGVDRGGIRGCWRDGRDRAIGGTGELCLEEVVVCDEERDERDEVLLV